MIIKDNSIADKISVNTILRELKEEALQLIYPRVCPVCGKILRKAAKDNNPYICGKCYEKLNIPEGNRCLKCSRPLQDDSKAFCDPCNSHVYNYDSGFALMLHDDISKKILYDIKYANKRDNADMLAYETAERLKDILKFWEPDIMVPIPLHKKRYFTRGFNQAELLAAKLSEQLRNHGVEIPVDSKLLKRVKNTSAQKILGEQERSANIRNAFEIDAEYAASQKYETVLLVDDIYTSGSTVSEAAGELKSAGIKKVYFLTFSIV